MPWGPVRMLAQLRYFGYIINPIVLYFCFNRSGSRVQAVLADVTNTPWNERHSYVIPGPDRSDSRWQHRCQKQFHVSPFLPMEMDYHWRLQVPGSRLRISIDNWEDQRRAFHAGLSMRRRSITGYELSRVLVRFPAITVSIAARIYWQAARLWMKNVTFFSHPAHDELQHDSSTSTQPALKN